MNSRHYPRVLTIAGSDSGGGAGIQADLKTISALGCYGASAITAITAQNTVGVTAIHSVPPETVEAQITAVLTDIGTDAVKVGMLHSPEIILAVGGTLRRFPVPHLVLDPVMVAASGDRLIQDNTVEVLVREMFPLAGIITPNLEEAELLLGETIRTGGRMVGAARSLLKLGSGSVLLKGGHLLGGRVIDVFLDRSSEGPLVIEHDRIDTPNVHGAGCTLSSAVASFLARGDTLPAAVRRAVEYVIRALAEGSAVATGKGRGPLNHFFEPERLQGMD